MTSEGDKWYCFDNAWQGRCDGSCELHRGECVVVHVDRWGYFSYCEEAIAEDQRRGLIVTKLNLLKMSRVDDARTPEQRAKDELGFPMEDMGR